MFRGEGVVFIDKVKAFTPGSLSQSYQLLELIAISGELPADQLSRLPGGDSYKANIIKGLKQKKLLLTYYKNGLRGYRLTAPAKALLLDRQPMRFSFYLTGSTGTNHIKSELTSRLRLHRVAEATVTMMGGGVSIYQDEKQMCFVLLGMPLPQPVWISRNSITPVKSRSSAPNL
jgi:hypothetical protein